VGIVAGAPTPSRSGSKRAFYVTLAALLMAIVGGRSGFGALTRRSLASVRWRDHLGDQWSASSASPSRDGKSVRDLGAAQHPGPIAWGMILFGEFSAPAQVCPRRRLRRRDVSVIILPAVVGAASGDAATNKTAGYFGRSAGVG
jgi:hypothetical protein